MQPDVIDAAMYRGTRSHLDGGVGGTQCAGRYRQMKTRARDSAIDLGVCHMGRTDRHCGCGVVECVCMYTPDGWALLKKTR